MDRPRHLRIYGLHSWSGIVLGLFVFVVCFTGCFALFYHEIQTWEDPARRLELAENPVDIDPILTAWVEETAAGEEIEFLRLSYPSETEPYYTTMFGVHPEGEKAEFFTARWDTTTGARLPERGAGLSEWLLDFHRDLMWPEGLGGRRIGRTLVGIAGIVLMLSIISGVVIHTKIFQELFTLRFFRSVRLKWQDTHKILGLWGLPFYSMIAVTGAFLGVVAILAPIVAILTFKGDEEALIEAVVGKPLEPAGIEAPMYPLMAVGTLRAETSGFAPSFVFAQNWGDSNARYDVYFEADTELAHVEAIQLNGVTGARVANSRMDTVTPAQRVTNAVSPLHYATFGGIALKLLYFILGLSLAVITAFGLMLWIERRLYGNAGRKSPAFYRRLSHLVTGTTLGFPLGTAVIFALDKLYTGAEATRLAWTAYTYFGVVGLAVIFAFLRRNDYRATKEIMAATGFVFMLVPVLNVMITGGGLPQLLTSGHKVAGYVDVALLSLGALTLLTASRLPDRRPDSVSREERRARQPQPNPDLPPVAAE